jgi:hypothetical protein
MTTPPPAVNPPKSFTTALLLFLGDIASSSNFVNS